VDRLIVYLAVLAAVAAALFRVFKAEAPARLLR
jgi:hypothetical protein